MEKVVFRSKNVKDSTASELKDSFNGWPLKPTAYFVHDNICYWATKTASYDPVFHLCGAAIKKVKIIHNYDYEKSWAATGAGVLHSFTFEKKTTRVNANPAPTVKKCQIAMENGLKAIYKVPGRVGGLVSNIQSEKPSVKQDGVFKECGMRTVHRLYLATAFTILRHLHGPDSRDGVVAIIVGQDGRILSWGRKNPAVPCWHDETSAIMALSGKIPAGSAVYSTLKPCKMCSGLIWEASGGNARVYWGQDDPGSAAQNTILESEKTGVLLDGNKTQSAPIFLPSNLKGAARPQAASSLETGFNESNKKSTIDYIMTDPALSVVKGVEAMLVAKHNKYTKFSENFNENTEFVVRYLIDFLDSLDIKFANLGK